MNKPKLNQPDVETSTTLSAEELQELIDEYCITPQNIREILIVGQMFRKSNLTIEEVKKEWEEAGYEWKEKDDCYVLVKYYRPDSDLKCIKNTILLWKSDKTYDSTKYDITLQEHQLLTKTFRALKWID